MGAIAITNGTNGTAAHKAAIYRRGQKVYYIGGRESSAGPRLSVGRVRTFLKPEPSSPSPFAQAGSIHLDVIEGDVGSQHVIGLADVFPYSPAGRDTASAKLEGECNLVLDGPVRFAKGGMLMIGERDMADELAKFLVGYDDMHARIVVTRKFRPKPDEGGRGRSTGRSSGHPTIFRASTRQPLRPGPSHAAASGSA